SFLKQGLHDDNTIAGVRIAQPLAILLHGESNPVRSRIQPCQVTNPTLSGHESNPVGSARETGKPFPAHSPLESR
ncbi:MAG: hypothetical protein MI807_00690, partial [Verrucomicrobiales bacterium]|nr:hypothetical protein [Verrucomicrobiales bacterium]